MTEQTEAPEPKYDIAVSFLSRDEASTSWSDGTRALLHLAYPALASQRMSGLFPKRVA
ncbi:MAG: hypothetical protein ACLPKB_35310 [Xanthobacteraceae bacterium]